MKFWKQASHLVARTRTSVLVGICFLTGLLVVAPLTLTDQYQETAFQHVLVSSMFFFWGLAGLVMAVRRDADFGVIRFEGLIALLLGVFIMLAGFAFALLPLFS